MRQGLILEECGLNIQHITGKDNTVADILSHLPSANKEQNDHNTEGRVQAKELFALQTDTIDDGFPLKLLTVQEEQQKE